MVVRGPSLRASSGATRWFRKLSNNPLGREGTPLLGLYWPYLLTRWRVPYDNSHAALANALKIIHLEKRLGISYEPIIQKGFITHALGVVRCANWFYVVGYFPVLILTAVQLSVWGAQIQVTGEGYQPVGRFLEEENGANGARWVNPADYADVATLLRGALLCSDVELEQVSAGNGEETVRLVGDPTEGALVVAAAKANMWMYLLASAQSTRSV